MREYGIVLAVAAVVTFLLTPIVRFLATRFGAMAQPRDRDVHAIPTARLGGVAVYGGVAAAMLVAHQLPALRQTFEFSSETTAVLIAGGMICLLGVLDDRWDLDPLTKSVGQIASAGVMVLFGVQLTFLFIPFSDLGTITLDSNTAVALTIVFCVFTVNAMNFIDGLDGLLAGVAAIAALAFFAYSYHLSREGYGDIASAPTLMTAVLAGACLGFLPHNFAPARIFMGDSGSMLVGLMLAAAATSSTARADAQTFSSAADALPIVLPLLLPIAVLAVPMVDLILAVIRRTKARRSPFSPDKMHLHHRLLEIGHTQRRAVLIMYVWSFLLAFGGVGMSIADPPLVLAGMGALLVVALVLSSIPRLRAARRHVR